MGRSVRHVSMKRFLTLAPRAFDDSCRFKNTDQDSFYLQGICVVLALRPENDVAIKI